MMTAPTNCVLVVVAHPDDEVLGCGGYIKKLSNAGYDVHVKYLGSGCQTRNNWSERRIQKQIDQVANELGFTPHYGEFVSSQLDTYSRFEINDSIKDVINSLSPRIVLTHDPNDLHLDHRIVYESTLVSCRFKPNSPVERVMTFPVISSSEINPAYDFRPNVYVDITETIISKCKGITYYKDELNAMKSHRNGASIKTHAQFYGKFVSVKYAEPLKLIRQLWTSIEPV